MTKACISVAAVALAACGGEHATPDASVYFIGRIRTPWTRREECPKNPRESDAVCTIELDPRFAPGLKDLETCSHVIVLYWMDKSRRDIVVQVPRPPAGGVKANDGTT